MWSEYGHPEDDYFAELHQVYPYQDDDGSMSSGKLIIAFHKGLMPAFDSKEFETLAEVKAWAKSELGITHWHNHQGRFTAKPI